jgi:hypothetical protein
VHFSTYFKFLLLYSLRGEKKININFSAKLLFAVDYFVNFRWIFVPHLSLTNSQISSMTYELLSMTRIADCCRHQPDVNERKKGVNLIQKFNFQPHLLFKFITHSFKLTSSKFCGCPCSVEVSMSQ